MVIAIITVLPVIILSNFPQVKLQFALNRSAYALLQQVRRAQELALSSQPYQDEFGIRQPVAGYGIYVDINHLGDKKYLLYADRLPANAQYDATDYVIETVDLGLSEPGVVIKSIGNVFGKNASIDFAAPDARVQVNQLDAGTRSIQVVLALESNPSITKSVIINTSGLVEIP